MHDRSETVVPNRASAGPSRNPATRKWVEKVYDIRTIQELLGHSDVKTTMIYTHVLNKAGGRRIKSPADSL